MRIVTVQRNQYSIFDSYLVDGEKKQIYLFIFQKLVGDETHADRVLPWMREVFSSSFSSSKKKELMICLASTFQ